jgi:alkylhydroperoxidase family enzyme
MSRIEMLSKEDALEIGRKHGVDDYIAQMNLFRVLLNFPEVAAKLNQLIIALVSADEVLSHRLRELIIMRVAWLCNSKYEWTQHYQVSLIFEITEAELVAIRDWQDSDCFNEADRAVLQATDDTLLKGCIQHDSWQLLTKVLPDVAAQIAVVSSIGNWRMFAEILNSLEIPLEEGAAVWPPDGLSPKN